MSEHARYGGSTAARTENCHGWRTLADHVPEGAASTYAQEGTLLHKAMERIYAEDFEGSPADVIGMTHEGIELTEDLYTEKIVPAVNALEAIFDLYDVDDFLIENRVKMSDLAWGTADVLAVGAVADSRVGLCIDFKFGQGVMVAAENNRQGLYYSAAAAVTPETADMFENISALAVGIIQPGNHETGEDFSLGNFDPREMHEYPEAFAGHVEICESVAYPIEPKDFHHFVPGAHCGFCPGRGICPATSGEIHELSRIDLTSPELLENLPVFDVLKRAESNIKALRALIHSQIEAGAVIRGFKNVPKKAVRSYSDPDAAERIARNSKKMKKDETHTSALLSPAQMEKLCKKKGLDFYKLFGAHVHKVSNGTTLVSEDDPRMSVPGLAELSALLDRQNT